MICKNCGKVVTDPRHYVRANLCGACNLEQITKDKETMNEIRRRYPDWNHNKFFQTFFMVDYGRLLDQIRGD